MKAWLCSSLTFSFRSRSEAQQCVAFDMSRLNGSARTAFKQLIYYIYLDSVELWGLRLLVLLSYEYDTTAMRFESSANGCCTATCLRVLRHDCVEVTH